MDFAILIHLAIVAFLAWGGVLSLACIARDAMWDSRPAD
jgi:hypothetical protein